MNYKLMNEDVDVNKYNHFMMEHYIEKDRVRKSRQRKQYDRDVRKSKWN